MSVYGNYQRTNNHYGGYQNSYQPYGPYGGINPYYQNRPRYGGGGQSSGNLMNLLRELLSRYEGGPPKHGMGLIMDDDDAFSNDKAKKLSGSGTLEGDDRKVKWLGTSDDDKMKLDDLEDSEVDIKTGRGDDRVEIKDVKDTEVRIHDFSNDDQLRLSGAAEDWEIDPDFEEGDDDGTLTLKNSETDTEVSLKLEDLEDFGKWTNGKFILNEDIFRFTG